ncbi:MAG: patatin-like phospholipase family protein [Acidobacteria bacterium]|nr:patatin-like phospholipase family protein [Acidobacteriota bacterium]
MNRVLHLLQSRRVGLALSGGSVRGLAHIGVIKALADLDIRPAVIAGTSAGSIIGAAVAAGLEWHEIASMARSVFWPSLLHGGRLERFCERHLPETFAHLSLPFAAVATALPSRHIITIREGHLASAISASCALRVIRRPVVRAGLRLKDGGIACVLPSLACRELGAEIVIGSDVWELSSLLRGAGMPSSKPRSRNFYPEHYRKALQQTDLLIQPAIPAAGYVPGPAAIERMIAAGEQATRQSLTQWRETEIV